MKKAYLATIELEAVIMAESEHEASLDAAGYLTQELKNHYGNPVGRIVIEKIRKCPNQWRGAIPYNSDDDHTVDQILPTGGMRIALP